MGFFRSVNAIHKTTRSWTVLTLACIALVNFTAAYAASSRPVRKLTEAEAKVQTEEADQPTISCEFQGPFPYSAAILVGGNYRCGAVLVDKNAVLTAASCVEDIRDQDGEGEIRLGGFFLSQPVEVRQFEKENIFVHPAYSPQFGQTSDLAVVTFDDATCLAPIPNLGRPLFSGEELSILGFGRTGETEPFSDVLRIANATEVDPLTGACERANILPNVQFCTITPACNCGSICEGDEGGPVIYRPSLRVFKDTLVGIISRTALGACEAEGTVGVHVDVQFHLNWIERILHNSDCY